MVEVKGYFEIMAPVLASALTPLHPGAGRVPGVVDLPVQRDPYGYPLVPASSVKGALKTQAGLRNRCVKDGMIKCENSNIACKTICCVFGPEPGSGDEGASAASVVDFFLLAIPVPSLEYGYVYVTSPMLLARAHGILEAATTDNIMFSKLSKVIDTMLGEAKGLRGHSVVALGIQDKVTLGLEKFTVKKTLGVDELELESLNPLYRAQPLGQNLVVVGDDVAPTVIEKGLVRVTRVRLDRKKKTVAQGALWTEEYLPPGSLFVGAITFTKPRNKYCKEAGVGNAEDVKKKFIELLSGSSNVALFYASVGGKETIGKGLMKLMID